MSANNEVYTLSDFKKCLVDPYKYVWNAVVLNVANILRKNFKQRRK